MSGVSYPTGFDATELAAGNPLTRPRIGHQTYTEDLTASAVLASSESDDGPADAPLRPDTVEFWEPIVVPATWVLNLGSAQDMDYVGIIHNLGSSGGTILVETSTNGVDYATFGADSSITPTDDNPLLLLQASTSIQYLRLTVSGAVSRIAVVYIGEVLKMETEIFGPHNPVSLSRETELYRGLSRGGQFLGQSFRRKNLVTDVSFQYLTSSWVRSNLDPFIKDARNRPFFFAWRPLDFPNDLAFMWAMSDIRPQYMGQSGFMSVGWNMVGYGNNE